jgi:hypothetical protein
MPQRPSEPIPAAPAPSAASAAEGMERARDMARKYLPDVVRLHAGVAFAPDSEASFVDACELRAATGGDRGRDSAGGPRTAPTGL